MCHAKGLNHFEGNSASVNGGALYMFISAEVYFCNNTTFKNNKARFGGAFASQNSTVYRFLLQTCKRK